MGFQNSMLSTLVGGLVFRWRKAFTLDLQAIAVFRIVLGLLILGDLAARCFDFRAHYSQDGILPRSAVADFSHPASVVSWGQLGEGPWEAVIILIVGACALGLVVGFASRWCVVLSFLFLGALQSRNPLVLYGADRLLMVMLFWSVFLPLGRRLGVDAMRYGRRGTGQVLSGGSVAVVLQVVVVYLFGFLSKTGEAWWGGDAVSMVLRLDAYTSDWGRWLAGYPQVTTGLTWGTLLVELVAPLLLLWPQRQVRLVGIGLLASLQLGFALFMELGWFPYVSLAALLPLVPTSGAPEVVDRKMGVVFGAWRRHDWIVMALAVIMVCANLAISQMEFQQRRLRNAVPDWLYTALDAARLVQSWSMFSPDPPDEEGWLIVVGKTEGGREVDLLQRRFLEGERRKPEDIQASLRSDRWKAYLLNLVQRRLSWQRAGQYLMGEWNSKVGVRDHVVSVRVVWMDGAGGGVELFKVEPR